jgi:hypothetical protein
MLVWFVCVEMATYRFPLRPVFCDCIFAHQELASPFPIKQGISGHIKVDRRVHRRVKCDRRLPIYAGLSRR